jgi:2-amino-4-hydroxy-6-hydroxymethyldihydropteridine diphosphokinase
LALAYLSLGSHAADALHKIDDAERRIGALPDIRLKERSADRSASSGRPRQRHFLYRLIGVETPIKARQLLDLMIGIETAMGRDHRDVWGGRLIDIDLIAYDDVEIRSSRLNLPHAFAHSRPYILEPLREIAPETAVFVVKVGTRPR